jgi:putative intracellular protease/amidase
VKGADGKPFVNEKKVTGFSNSEEAAVGLVDVVPFLVESELQKLGGHYSKGPDWASHVVVDGQLVTGQNPGSSEASAKAVVKMLA